MTRTMSSRVNLQLSRGRVPSSLIDVDAAARLRNGEHSGLYRLAKYTAEGLRRSGECAPLPDMQGVLRHPDDHLLRPHLLLKVYTNHPVCRRTMSSLQDCGPGEQATKQLGATGGGGYFHRGQTSGDSCGAERAGGACSPSEPPWKAKKDASWS